MSSRLKPSLFSALIVLLPTALSAQGVVKKPSRAKPAANAKRVAVPALFDDKGLVIGADPEGGGAGGKFGARRGGRNRLRGRRLGVATAIGEGLEWLQRHQDKDGGWDAGRFMRHDKTGRKSDAPGEHLGRVGITGFCLLSFLGDGSMLGHGPYKDAVRNGVSFLRKQQMKTGAYSTNLLEHAVASYAICEATGLSMSEVLREEARAALDYLVKFQKPDGGFRFDGQGKRSDAYTTVHALFALKSGVEFRIVKDKTALHRIAAWRTAASDVAAPSDISPIAYGIRRNETIVAAKLVTGFFLGLDPKRAPDMINAASVIGAHLPTDSKKEADLAYWYLATYGCYQMGARHWDTWQSALMPGLVDRQRDDGNFAGSWDPLGKGVVHGGRVYATALSVLTAESYYRYTRLVR